MASSDKCPRCDCEGNKLGCEICYYYGFKCPGNCACCAKQRVPTTTQIQSKTVNGSNPNSTKKQVTTSNQQKMPTQRKRTPLRPLILRNVKKSIVENQKKEAAAAAAAASNNVPQCKPVNPTVSESNENMGASGVNEPFPNPMNSSIKPMHPKLDAEAQFPRIVADNEIEKEIQKAKRDLKRKENAEMQRLWYGLFWPRWEKVPCAPYVTQPVVDTRKKKTEALTKEKLEEGINETIGDHCLNCHCKNPRDSCDICRQMDFECLGSCQCCLHFRAAQRYMIFITPGLYKLSDGSFYGGGNLNS